MNEYLTAICFYHSNYGKLPLKYRNIKNKEKFLEYVRQKGILYVNFYSKRTKEYVGREWLN